MANKRGKRVFIRDQGGVVRFYGDFRDYGDVGGKVEALIPANAKRATTDEKLAQLITAARIADLGRYRGTFFVPAHIRGTDEHRRVEKTYVRAETRLHEIERVAGNPGNG